jgi:diguanylate cyclase (GGDEF)-like protein
MRSLANLAMAVLEKHRVEDCMQHAAKFDALTGLPNRLVFNESLQNGIKQCLNESRPLPVIIVKIDRFKEILDSFGYEAGDQLLKGIAAMLDYSVRGNNEIAHFGNEEFAIALLDLETSPDIVREVFALLDMLQKPFLINGEEIFVSFSSGIAVFPDDGDNSEAIIRNAKIAMNCARELGGNCAQFHRPQMSSDVAQRLRLEHDLRRSLTCKEISVHYQPKVDVATGKICGAEALLRWTHPIRGNVPPSLFIPVLEETGLIVPVGLWVIDAVCEQLSIWRSAGLSAPPVAINISGRQLSEKNLVASIRHILEAREIGAEMIELEITESMLMQDSVKAIEVLTQLRALGLKLSLDDFGTGYSSLAYLKRFPLDCLKIDRAFISDIETNPDDRAIVGAIIAMSHSLGLTVIAEGVEGAFQLEYLRENHCHLMQGYYFARPCSAAGYEQMLRNGLPACRVAAASGESAGPRLPLSTLTLAQQDFSPVPSLLTDTSDQAKYTEMKNGECNA